MAQQESGRNAQVILKTEGLIPMNFSVLQAELMTKTGVIIKKIVTLRSSNVVMTATHPAFVKEVMEMRGKIVIQVFLLLIQQSYK